MKNLKLRISWILKGDSTWIALESSPKVEAAQVRVSKSLQGSI